MSSGYVIIGNAQSRRVPLFQDALQRLGRPAATLVPWIDFLRGTIDLREIVTANSVVRIESPGKDFEVEKAILGLGSNAPKEPPFYDQLPGKSVMALTFDKGRILYPRQWYHGFVQALTTLQLQLFGCPGHQLMQSVTNVLRMFDKPSCHSRLLAAGISVPAAMSVNPADHSGFFDLLLAQMQAHGWGRVFIKLANGSSASGVVAFETDGERHRATTTVEMVSKQGRLALYNSRQPRVYDERDEIETLANALSRHRVHVERWIPKAGIKGKTFDLRVVTIAGRARHVVVRLSSGPMTNLHLLNDRDSEEAVRSRMGEEAWNAAMTTCEKTAACFKHSLYCGIDLLIFPDFRSHAVLEVNAFGDLLPGSLHDGVDTYTAEILAMDNR